jgi:hypothetical protein
MGEQHDRAAKTEAMSNSGAVTLREIGLPMPRESAT